MRFFFVPALAAFALLATGRAQNLLENGSFEEPATNGRTPADAGGTPAKVGEKPSWRAFGNSEETNGGRLIAGVTNEIARTGKQSLFLNFEKVIAPARVAVLQTEMIAVKPAQAYRVSMWGRVDRKRPLSLDERRPYMTLEVRFFATDQTTEIGEAISGAQLIPGNVVPGSTPELTFRSGKWKESFAKITSPPAAVFMRVTWTWATPTDEGETDGVLYWDDASILEEAPPQQ